MNVTTATLNFRPAIYINLNSLTHFNTPSNTKFKSVLEIHFL